MHIRSGLVGVMALLAVTAAACGSSPSGNAVRSTSSTSSALTTVTVGVYPGLYFSLAAEVAKDQGIFQKNGLNPDFVYLTSGPAVVAAMVAGSMQFGENSTDNLLIDHSKGTGVVAVVGNVGVMPYKVMVRKSISVPTGESYPGIIHTLKGLNLAVAALRSSNQFIWERMLKDAGMSSNEATYVTVAPGSDNAALSAGQADAILAIPPQGSICEAQGICKPLPGVNMRVGQGPQDLSKVPYNTWWTTQSYAKQHPGVVKKFQQTMIDADNYIHKSSNLQTVLKIADAFLPTQGIPTSQLNQVIKSNLFMLSSGIPNGTITAWNHLLVSGGLLSSPLPRSEVVLASAPKQAAS